jgi:hypothetical protein
MNKVVNMDQTLPLSNFLEHALDKDNIHKRLKWNIT